MGSIADLSETNLLEAAFLAHENPVFVVGWKTRRILAASDSVQRVFGWRPDEIRGCTSGFLHVDDESFRRFGEITERALASGQQVYHCYHQMRRRDGSVFNTEHRLGVVRDETGEPVAAVSIVHDRAESDPIAGAMREHSLDFQALSDRLPGGIFQRVRRADGTVLYNFIQGNLARRFGIAPEEAMQSPEAILGQLHPEDRMWLEHALEKTSRSLSVLGSGGQGLYPGWPCALVAQHFPACASG